MTAHATSHIHHTKPPRLPTAVLTKQKLDLFKVVGGDVPLSKPLTVMVR